ncbi:AAA family ATPase [Chengkuizengella axinellae]|uniref:AAA family ATPase n=1 Tax=Chengkuizengella axinellae TaxID=3064388 RepID=A0ABT9IZ75_9BACL|nr:AAA family ATPase [Chengkuizengella sp. 2205SS18-9]MDP5274094.1 AAA family ATPase [Chengkuizengella sp. 2205SS18-9]
MDKISIIIASSDLEYVEALSRFFISSGFGEKFSILFFTEEPLLREYIQCNEVDVLLIDEVWLSIVSTYQMYIQILSESNEDLDSDYPTHYKYQPIDELLLSIKKSCFELKKTNNREKKNELKTKVVSIFSPAGGSGKTTLAMNLTKQITSFQQQVVYISLETFYAPQFTLSNTEETNTFSKLIYYLKTNPNVLQNNLEEYTQFHSSLHCDFIQPSLCWQDMMDIQLNDMKKLIQFIKETNKYNYIVIDCSTSLHERILGALQESDYILNLVLDDIQCILKMKQWSQQSGTVNGVSLNEVFSASTKCILNKQTNDLTNNIKKHDVKIDGNLPYIPEWKSTQHIDQILTEEIYNQHVIQIFKQWLQ